MTIIIMIIFLYFFLDILAPHISEETSGDPTVQKHPTHRSKQSQLHFSRSLARAQVSDEQGLHSHAPPFPNPMSASGLLVLTPTHRTLPKNPQRPEQFAKNPQLNAISTNHCKAKCAYSQRSQLLFAVSTFLLASDQGTKVPP